MLSLSQLLVCLTTYTFILKRININLRKYLTYPYFQSFISCKKGRRINKMLIYVVVFKTRFCYLDILAVFCHAQKSLAPLFEYNVGEFFVCLVKNLFQIR